MELPHLGNNCALKECNQLDFLPVKCDACSEIFCLRHYRYEAHQCTQARNKNNQVPVCPLCSQPVVGSKRDQLPDVAVSEHIDKYCEGNELLKRNGPSKDKSKSGLQSCSFARCKQKDVIYLECNECRSKFCIKHRHPSDHSCSGPPSISTNLAGSWHSFKGSCSTSAEMLKNRAQRISKSGQAAFHRIQSQTAHNWTSTGRNSTISSLQGNLTEQEALALALDESKRNNAAIRPDEDLALARALQESQMDQTRRNNQNKDSCVLS